MLSRPDPLPFQRGCGYARLPSTLARKRKIGVNLAPPQGKKRASGQEEKIYYKNNRGSFWELENRIIGRKKKNIKVPIILFLCRIVGLALDAPQCIKILFPNSYYKIIYNKNTNNSGIIPQRLAPPIFYYPCSHQYFITQLIILIVINYSRMSPPNSKLLPPPLGLGEHISL